MISLRNMKLNLVTIMAILLKNNVMKYPTLHVRKLIIMMCRIKKYEEKEYYSRHKGRMDKVKELLRLGKGSNGRGGILDKIEQISHEQLDYLLKLHKEHL